MNKNYIYIVISAVFFFLSMYVATFLKFPDTTSGSTSSLPYVNALITIAGIFLLAASIGFFTIYYRNCGEMHKNEKTK